MFNKRIYPYDTKLYKKADNENSSSVFNIDYDVHYYTLQSFKLKLNLCMEKK
jgi:hypothetical protein